MKKKEQTEEFLRANPGLLACPLCGGAMELSNTGAVVCPHRHSFDIAAQGYVNLLQSPAHGGYGAEMLESRLRVCRSGFFDGLVREVRQTILEYAPRRGRTRILDTGCGEGSQLAQLLGLLDGDGLPACGVGVDNSRDAVRIAAREYPGALWLVADLARLPLAGSSIDAVINILSPSNYDQFDRVLKEDGLLVKAVPGEGYLNELRRVLYQGDEKEKYSGEKVIRLFEDRYQLTGKVRIQTEFPVPNGLWPHIVAMTPMSWGAGEARRREALENAMKSVTLDFTLLAGRKRSG